MGVVKDLLQDVEIPKFYKVSYKLDDTHVEDVPQAVRDALKREGTLDQIKPGSTVCFTAASREIANSVLILRTFAEELRRVGATPYIVPAMGSHGGATAEGQRAILDHYGITEEACGCEIHATMETKKVGVSAEGLDVRLDAFALSCDYIVPVGRIKPHTDFHGTFESGIMKMLAIGLGKQYGASLCHQAGFKNMGRLVPMFANVILDRCNILFGLAIVENAYSRTCILEAALARDIPGTDARLLVKARSLMPRILFDDIAVLVIDEIGKNFSGDGQDPNVSSRFATPYASGDFSIQKVCVLDISEKSHGIMIGAGCADTCTRRLVDKADLEASYINAITSTVFDCVRLPMILKNDYYAMAACIRTCNEVDRDQIRMVRIPNTLEIGEILISESMMADAGKNPRIEILSEPEPMKFDENGNLVR